MNCSKTQEEMYSCIQENYCNSCAIPDCTGEEADMEQCLSEICEDCNEC